MKKVLVFGAGGHLAGHIIRVAPPEIECVSLLRAEADITNAVQVAAALEATRPDFVINGAAYNLVDKVETDGLGSALAINALGAATLAHACRDTDIPLLHFSTDFVFSGRGSTPYKEIDPTKPVNAYGASKLAGENLVLAAAPHNIVIRVCRLFGPPAAPGQKASGFPALMLRLARERDEVGVVRGQIGSPGYTPDLARAIWQLLENSDGGLYHLSNAGEVAFDDYARAVFAAAKVSCRVVSLSSEEFGAAAQRPEYSTLSNAKIESVGVEPSRHWREALEDFVRTG